MGYLDNRKQRFRNDLYKNLYNDDTSIHVHFTEGGIISWGVGVKEETPNATQRMWMAHPSMTQNCSLSKIYRAEGPSVMDVKDNSINWHIKTPEDKLLCISIFGLSYTVHVLSFFMQWLRIRKATILLHRWEFLNFY
jgi:hypothetical protein